MYMGARTFVMAVMTLVQFLGQSNGEGLVAKVAGAKFPTMLHRSTAVYDGTDSVYIIGG
jgi:hypothetical protein